MKPNGHIVLNGDDDKLITVREYNGVKPVFFGLNSERDVYADQIESKGLKGVACRIHLGEDALTYSFRLQEYIWSTMPWQLRL